jgi:hypothetical protein
LGAPSTRDLLVNGDFARGLAAWQASASDVSASGNTLSFNDGDDAAEEACLSQTVAGVVAGERLSFSVDLASRDTRPGWWRFVRIRLAQEGASAPLVDWLESVGEGADASKRARVTTTALTSDAVTVSLCISDNDPSPLLLSRARLLATGESPASLPMRFDEMRGTCPQDLRIETTSERDGAQLIVREHLAAQAFVESNYRTHGFSKSKGHAFEVRLPAAYSSCSTTVRDPLGRIDGAIRDGILSVRLDALAGASRPAGYTLTRATLEGSYPSWELVGPAAP